MSITSVVVNPAELEHVLLRVAAGDPRAFAQLVTRTRTPVRAIARRWLRSNEDAEEVAQDVFAQVWAQAASFDARRGSVIGWLSTITRNKSIDRLRLRRSVISLDEVAEHLACDSLGPEDQLIKNQSADELHAALTMLAAPRRRVLILAFFEGQTHEEVAQTESIPLGTAKSHARRAMISLREHMVVFTK
jgi:RNA polymerase sigma-70 factor (ECF subfamily)